MKKLTFGLLILALTSCMGGKNPTPYPTEIPTATIVSPTIPSIKPVVTAAVPNSEMVEPSPTRVRPTPTVTLEPFPGSYDLPVWMKTTETTIAAAVISNEPENTRNITFFNAATGESHEILMNRSTSGFFWYDNQNFGFLASDLKTVYRLNLTSGKVFLEEMPPLAARLVEPDWINGFVNGLNIVDSSVSNQEITFTATWQQDVSKSGTYTAIKKTDWDGITVLNNLTNEIVLDIKMPDKTYITVYEWSPENNNLLAYVQGKYDNYFSFITEDMTLNIVDVANGKVLKTFSGDFGWMSWSPDGNKLLYKNAKSNYSTYGIGFTEAPCIIFLNTDEQRCLYSIPRNVPSGYTLATTTQYDWSSDSERIFYRALYQKDQETYSIRGDVCIYDLINGHIFCPTEKLEILTERDASYRFSPNEEYIYLCMSKSTSLNDYADDSIDGILKTDGSIFFTWQGTVRKESPFELCSYDVLWRPLP